MIAGAVKYFRFTVDYVLNELSYTNLILLSAAIPDYGAKDEDEKKDDVTINASDPSNNALLERYLKNL